MNIRQLAISFAVASVAAFAIAYPAVSSASADKRVPCTLVQGWNLNVPVCAWEDTSYFRASSLSALNIHWNQPNAGNFVAGQYKSKACISYYNAEGGACGVEAQNAPFTGPAPVFLSPDRSVWTAANTPHFKYVTYGGEFGGFTPYLRGLYAFMPWPEDQTVEIRAVTLVVAVIAAGAVGGAVAAVAVAKSFQPRAQAESPAPPARDEREAAWADLARELRRATPAAPPPSASVGAPATASAEAPAEELRPPDPVADRAALDREYAEDRLRHDRDGRDPAWATRAETSLQHSITSIAGEQRVIGVECKTTSCIAHLEWDSRELASKGYGKLLVGSFEPNCAAKILLHEQDSPGKPYQEDLILDCTNSRAEGLWVP
jgi:hypothetical protein